MRQLNTKIVSTSIILIMQALLMQACSTDVGGDEDRTAPVVTLTSLNDGEEVIGDFIITWETNEPNKSTVDIHLSYGPDDDGNYIYNDVDAVVLNTPDTGSFIWETNDIPSLKDCRTCRIKITPTDVARNVGGSAESAQDFIINNVPQVLGSAFYTDLGNDGPGDGDSIRVPFDKDVELLTSIASDIFFFPVLGDSIGPFATVAKGARQNELVMTFNKLVATDFHLHIRDLFKQEKLNRTAPSGMNILDNLAQGILFARDTDRTAAPVENGIDIAPTFSDSGRALGNSEIDTTSVAFGDVDGDGDLDLVSGSWDSLFLIGATNRVWLNDGTGVFTDSGQALGNSNTTSVVLGDVDGDGDVDIVSGNFGSNRVWLNDGTGVFADSGQALGTSGTRSVALGDVDGDGDLDLVSGNEEWFSSFGEPNRVWLNDGTGVFTDSGQALGSSPTISMALGDVDGDGDLDFVSGNNFGQANRVWRNDGGGTFVDFGQVLGSSETRSVVLGDVDGDGDLDLVSGNFGEVNRVWFNDGSGMFNDSGQVLGISNTKAVAFGDVDGDGDLDLVSANAFQESRVWRNSARSPGMNIFMDLEESLGSNSTRSVALGDLDGDGDLDVVSGNGESFFSGESNRVWFNDGSGMLNDTGQALGDSNTIAVALGDIDGDGDLDLVSGNSGPNGVWINDSAGGFTDSEQALGSSGTGSIALGDVDGDGDLDLVSGNFGEANRVWFNDGSGMFNDSGQALGISNTEAVALGDVDGDGDLDLVSGNALEANRVWRNDGVGVFTDSGQALGVSNTKAVALGDVDGDGDLDLVSGNAFGQPNRVWLNDGMGVFTDSGQALGNSETTSVALNDIDGDGDLDLVSGNGFTEVTNRVWLNDGIGKFSLEPQPLGNSDTRSVVLGDVDGDGDPDLVTGNFGEANHVWLNDY